MNTENKAILAGLRSINSLPATRNIAGSKTHFVSNGVLHELKDSSSGYIKRKLVKENGSFRWVEGGFSFLVYVSSPTFLTSEEAALFEKSVISEEGNAIGN